MKPMGDEVMFNGCMRIVLCTSLVMAADLVQGEEWTQFRGSDFTVRIGSIPGVLACTATSISCDGLSLRGAYGNR